MTRERQLEQDTGDAGIRIELSQGRRELVLADVAGQMPVKVPIPA